MTPTGPNIVDTQLTLILPEMYPQYGTIQFGINYQEWCFGSCSIVFMYFFLYHYIVL
jgi:hypothetical protein